jgi:hypothetical protein
MEARTFSSSRVMSNPLTAAVPLVGARRVLSMRMSVLLPAPFDPNRPNNSPGSTLSDTSRTARTSRP